MTDREKIIELINEIIRLRMKLTDPYFCPAYEDIEQDRPCDRFDECRRCHQNFFTELQKKYKEKYLDN